MSQNSQLHLTNDSFIYACQSEFAARTKKDGSFNSHLRFEDFLTDSFQRPENPSMKDVTRIFSAITQHQTLVTPQFRRHEPINLETVSYFTCAIATLFADLESACKEFFGCSLPIIPETPPDYSAEAPVSNALLKARSVFLANRRDESQEVIEFNAFPRPELPTLTAEQQSQIWACEIWDLIADALHSSLSEYADAAMAFAYWKYQEVPAKAEIDWRVRPPVGEAYAKAFKPLLRSSRGDRPDRGGERRDRPDRKERTDRGERSHGQERPRNERPMKRASEADHATSSAESLQPPKEASGPAARTPSERPRRSDVSGHGRPDRAERHTGRGDRTRSNADSRHAVGTTGQSSEQQLNDALEEVRQAASALKGNPNMGEIQLKPNNSFIRRQQHSLAVEMGFDTESRGEGRDRGVVLRMAQL